MSGDAEPEDVAGQSVAVRPMKKDDVYGGFAETLSALRDCGLDGPEMERIFHIIEKNPHHTVFVAEMNGRVVACATLIVEQKFIHGGARAGHIEDVAVSKEAQGKGLGIKLIKSMLEYAKGRGCYKTTLDCADDVVGFYARAGFAKRGHEMRFDH